MGDYCYLVKVDGNANNNKFYEMKTENGQLICRYGRVGQNGQLATYSASQFESKRREKLNKGYVDQTDLHTAPVISEKTGEYKEIPNIQVRELVRKLRACARDAIKRNYTVSSAKVTQAMCDEAQFQINKMMNGIVANCGVELFNRELEKLFMIIPRAMSRVVDHLAKSTSDFTKIIEREQNILDVMKGEVKAQAVEKKPDISTAEKDITILEAFGLTIVPVTSEQEKFVKKWLGASSHRYKRAWKVVNKATQEKFDKFVKENADENGDFEIRYLWHGSRNENWWSIMTTGLSLNPNAVITGKMFGYGLYFANEADKSINYTSISGSYWARGSSNTAYLALYDVAYGKALNVYDFNSKFHTFRWADLRREKPNATCLHARAGKGMLRRDEIIVYKEEQTTISYLVEIA